MSWLHVTAVIFHMLLAAAIVGLVLLQRGRGADAGAGFGAGASGTVFGARGSASFLSRTTAVLAALFFVTSLTLAYFGNKQTVAPASVIDRLPQPTAPADSGTNAGGQAGQQNTLQIPSDVPPATNPPTDSPAPSNNP